ncbi:hypothetical protein C9J01_02030 [Photobacterium rosenbergii]|uniref:Putative Flp pilus-assembly TadG-like N-terminal domain-containing protein n=1 Tax=Photobacterium rosenbergii TaxID=294936 RepID=A0A2T3NJY3_9GAMM|nr:Tad domain-containing protein [Photobacterium rosenbergii]PSW15817.1 hypothetical protein C9J01_02030 [Photobacterium rosenbergii]
MNIYQKRKSPQKQKGVIVVFSTLAMAVLIGAGALALDVGNLILSKGKLQNLADSAALTAAKTIDLGGDQASAITAGTNAINNNLSYDGFKAISLDSATITFEFSESLPFDSSTATTSSTYVRVRIENVDIPDFLVSIMNIDLNTRASAVAGPSSSMGSSCNIVPLSICAGPDHSDTNISGYDMSTHHVLKASSSTPSDIGAGNFMPVSLGDNGADAYGDALAGSYDSCLSTSDTITTEPGNMVGKTLALDTRFEFSEADKDLEPNGYKKTEFLPDMYSDFSRDNAVYVMENTNEGASYITGPVHDDVMTYSEYKTNYDGYENYEACLESSACQKKGYYRRVLTVPILDCDEIITKANGRAEVKMLGFGCFFLTQPVSVTSEQSGDNSKNGGAGNGSWIVGEFISNCRNNSGNPSYEPNETGPYRIVLFDDPDSGDS